MACWTIDVSTTTAVTGPDGTSFDLRGKERAVVAALALHHPDPATAASLAPLVWGDELPATAVKAVHNHVSRLRRQVPDLVETSENGYRFAPDDVMIESSGSASCYADLADQPQVTLARARDRTRALHDAEERILREIRVTCDDELCARLEQMREAAPQRLVRWWWNAVVDARLGRRPRALEILRESRRWHGTANGDPAAERAIGRLEQAIIDDDVFIDSPAALAPEAFGAGDATTDEPAAPGGDPTGIIDPTGAIAAVAADFEAGASSVLLVAPAGGGKSTAVRALLARMPARGWHCFHAACSPIQTDPLRPIADLLRARRERDGLDTDDDHAAWKTTGAASGDRATALIRATVAPANRRVFLVIDDVHHADGPTLDYLARLVQAVDAATPRVAILLTTRPVDASLDVRDVTALPGWDRDAMRQYLRAYAPPGAWAEGAADWLADASGGNPLAARDLTIEALRTIPDEAATPFVPPPRRIVDGPASAQHLTALGASVRSVLQVAAVLGEEFRRSDLSRLDPGSAADLAVAEANGLVTTVGEDRVRFGHQTFRQSVLDTLEPAAVADVAHRVAVSIDLAANRSERLEELGHFAREAASIDPSLAITATVDEVTAAYEAMRYDAALTTARLALELIERHEGRTSRWCAIGVLAGRVGIDIGADDAVDLVADAGRRAIVLGEHDLVADAAWSLCALSPITTVGAIGALQQELLDHALANVTDPAVRARACVGGAFAWALADVPETSRDLYFEAEAASRHLGDPNVRGEVLVRSYTPLSQPGDVPIRRRIAAELHELGDRLGRIEYTYEACRLDFGDAIHRGTEDPRPAMARLEAMAAELGQRGRNWSLTSFRATLALLDGDLDAAERHAGVLLTDEVTASAQLVTSTYGALLIGIRLAQGRIGELDPLIADLADKQSEMQIWRAVRVLTAADSDPAAASSAFDSVFGDGRHTLPPSFTMLPGLTVAAEGAWRLGDEGRMREMVAHLTPYAGWWAFFNVGTVGPVDLTLARLHRRLGDHDAAHTCIARGLRSTARVGAPTFAAQLAELVAGPP